jgi:very-short-patch-repair endonuclease
MKLHISRTLRKNQTPWESKLWNKIRNEGIEDLKFRRQYKIGKFIVDFCCINKKIIIELDGGQHNTEENIEKDKERQKYLENEGFKVLRFWNNEIDNNLDGVILKILEAAKPHPQPLSENGEGGLKAG